MGVQEWIDTSAGSGDWNALLALEKNTNTRHLFGLHHDPYMFHQANLNYVTAGMTTINGVSKKLSLIQAWAETVTQEFTRLVSWPLISTSSTAWPETSALHNYPTPPTQPQRPSRPSLSLPPATPALLRSQSPSQVLLPAPKVSPPRRLAQILSPSGSRCPDRQSHSLSAHLLHTKHSFRPMTQ